MTTRNAQSSQVWWFGQGTSIDSSICHLAELTWLTALLRLKPCTQHCCFFFFFRASYCRWKNGQIPGIWIHLEHGSIIKATHSWTFFVTSAVAPVMLIMVHLCSSCRMIPDQLLFDIWNSDILRFSVYQDTPTNFLLSPGTSEGHMSNEVSALGESCVPEWLCGGWFCGTMCHQWKRRMKVPSMW